MRSMNQACINKCIKKFSDDALAVGENTCLDRCVVKYMATAGVISETMQVRFAA